MWQKYQYNYWYKNVRGRRKPSKKLQGREVRQREFALEPGAFHVWWEEERQKLEEEDMNTEMTDRPNAKPLRLTMDVGCTLAQMLMDPKNGRCVELWDSSRLDFDVNLCAMLVKGKIFQAWFYTTRVVSFNCIGLAYFKYCSLEPDNEILPSWSKVDR